MNEIKNTSYAPEKNDNTKTIIKTVLGISAVVIIIVLIALIKSPEEKFREKLDQVGIKGYMNSVYLSGAPDGSIKDMNTSSSSASIPETIGELIKMYEDSDKNNSVSVTKTSEIYENIDGADDFYREEGKSYFEVVFLTEFNDIFLFSIDEYDTIEPVAMICKEPNSVEAFMVVNPQVVIKNMCRIVTKPRVKAYYQKMTVEDFIYEYNRELHNKCGGNYGVMDMCSIPYGYEHEIYKEDGTYRHYYEFDGSNLFLCMREDMETGVLTEVYLGTRGDYTIYNYYNTGSDARQKTLFSANAMISAAGIYATVEDFRYRDTIVYGNKTLKYYDGSNFKGYIIEF